MYPYPNQNSAHTQQVASTSNTNFQMHPAQLLYQYSQQPIPGNPYTNLTTNESSQLDTLMPQSQAQQLSQISQWQTVERKRGRKENTDKTAQANKQTKCSNYWLNPPTHTSNRYETLQDKDTENEDIELEQTGQENINTSEPKPPPIFVSGVKAIAPLHKLLDQIAKDEYDIKILYNDEVKILPKTSEKYTTITKALSERNTEFHTYQLKQARNFRVVLRNVHPSADISQLKTELHSMGHEVVNIHNIKQRGTKIELPLFFVDLKAKENNKEIYNVNKLNHSIVIFEPPHTKRDIPQCAKCQKHGHTKKFCNRSPKCVKCAGNHLTAQCLWKEPSNNVKCVNCNGNHPANYKGCSVYKELQAKNFPPLREKQMINIETPRHNLPRLSYSEVTNRGTQQQNMNNSEQSQQISNEFKELNQMLKTLMEQMSTMLNLLTTIVSKLT